MKRSATATMTGRLAGLASVILGLVCVSAWVEAAPSKADIAKALATGIKPNNRFESKTYIGACRRARKAIYRCNICTASVKISSFGAPMAHYSGGADLRALRLREQHPPAKKVKILQARRVDRLVVKGKSYKLKRISDNKFDWKEHTVGNNDGPRIFARAKSWCEKRLK